MIAVQSEAQREFVDEFSAESRIEPADGLESAADPKRTFEEAIRHHHSGRLDEAERLYRKLLSIRPDFLFGHLNLGKVLEARGRFDEALACYETALRIDPDSFEAHLCLGNHGLAIGDPHRAVAAYGRAAELRPDLGAPHNGQGSALLRLGRTRDAEESFRRALELAPSSAPARNNLGIALMERGRTAEAIACYRQALALDPKLAQAHNNLGNALQLQGEVDGAVASYARALELAPSYVEARYNLALAKTFEPGDPALAELVRLRDRMPEAAEERPALSFALGKAYADLGDHAAAFEAFAEGNRLRRSSISFDAAREEEAHDRLIAAFPRSLFAERSDFGFSSAVPIFIVGMPRTGKTLVERMLRRHPALHAGGEPDFVPEIAAAFPTRLGATYPDGVARMTRRQARELGQEYVAQATAIAGPAARFTDTLPGNFLHLGLIQLILPRAAILHCVRGTMDACLACYCTNFARGQTFSFDLEELGRYFLSYCRLMRHWQEVLPTPVMEVRYEELVENPREVMTRVESFCGLADAEARREAAAGDAFPAMHTDEIGRWRRYETQLEPLARILANRSPED